MKLRVSLQTGDLLDINGKLKFDPKLNQVAHHEDILHLTKHCAMKTVGGMEV